MSGCNKVVLDEVLIESAEHRIHRRFRVFLQVELVFHTELSS